MPEFGGIALWLWIVLVLALIAAVVGAFFGVRYAAFRVVRRYVVRMVGAKEQVLASRRTLEAVMRHLADESDEALIAFSTDPHNVDRRAFAEVNVRMGIVRDELDTKRIPARIVPVAEALADAAHVIAEESGRIHDEMSAELVLEAVGSMDLARVSRQFDKAASLLADACAEYEVEDAAVYGGGMYI